ncbi:MAG: hypothetical protein HUU60_11780 [Armatimonadetes bacterium]|nr:hypothetical protein [Armatimonadota bacterium]
MRQGLTITATVVGALACTACCWGPPVAIALLGTGAGWLSALEAYEPYLLAFTALQLGIGFYLAYRPVKGVCPRHAKIDPAFKRRLTIGIMWGITVFVVLLNIWSHARQLH